MMKRIHILLMALLMGMLCHAQLLPTDSTRYGAKDPQKAIELYKLVFQDKDSPIKQGNESMPITEEFYIKFRRLADLAPYLNYYPYSGYYYENPTSLYQRMLDSIADPAFKVMLVEDVVACGQMFVDHLDSINVVRDWNPQTKGNPLTMPLAKIKRAHYNYKFAHDPKYYPAHLYDKEKAYKLYREAFKEFLAAKDSSNQQNNTELEGFYVGEYYKVCEDLYKVDEEKYYEQFLADYLEIVQVCDKLLIPYYDIPDTIKDNESDPQYAMYRGYNYWTNAKKEAGQDDDGIKASFAASGAATPERLSAYYDAKLNENRRDSAYLNKAIEIMNENGCSQTETYFSYCEASYLIRPTYLNCIGCAFASKEYKMRNEMIKYFLEAYDMATNDVQRGIIAYLIGYETNIPRPKDENGETYDRNSPETVEWTNNILLAIANLKLVLKYQDALATSTAIAIRKYPAHAAYQLGWAYYRMCPITRSINECDEAISYVNMAMAASPKDYNENARSLINNINATRAQLMEINRNAKQRAKQQAEYEEYIRRKKKEEEFWLQK